MRYTLLSLSCLVLLTSCTVSPEPLATTSSGVGLSSSGARVEQILAEKSDTTIAPSQINVGITLEVDAKGCKQRVIQGERVRVADLVGLIQKELPKERIGLVDEICFAPVQFRQIQQSSHILLQLAGGGKEHASFGNIYVLTLEDQRFLPLEYFNKQLSEKKGALTLAPDGKRGVFVDGENSRQLWFLRFDQNILKVVKTLGEKETWNSSTFWSDVELNANWINDNTLRLQVYTKDKGETSSNSKVRWETIVLE